MLKNKRLLTLGLFALLSGAPTLQAQDLEQAIKLIESGNLSKAKGLLNELIEQSPSQGLNYYYLGETYLQENQIDSAKAIFNKGLEVKDNGTLNYIGLGQIDLLNNDSQGAVLNFAKAQSKIKRRAYDQKLLVAQGYLTGSNPNYEMAISIAKEVLAEDVQNSQAFTVLGQAQFAKGDVQDAYGNFRHAVTTNPDNITAKLALALILQKSGGYEQSALQLEDLIKSDPDFLPTYKALGDTYYFWSLKNKAQSSYLQQKAAQAYKMYMDKKPGDLKATLDYVQFKMDTSSMADVSSILDQLYEQNPNNQELNLFIGQAYFQAKEYGKAVSILQNYLDKNPNSGADVYFELGASYLFVGKEKQKALEYLNKSIAMDNSLSVKFNAIGVELFRKKEYLDAIDVFKIGASDTTGANFAYDLYYIGYCYYLLADESQPGQESYVEQSNIYFDKCIAANPSIFEAYFFKARANRLLSQDPNNYLLVVKSYSDFVQQIKASEQKLDNVDVSRLVEAYNWLGSYYANNDQDQKAIECFNMTLAMDQDNEYALQTLRALDGM